jgi:hypothetical protein
MIVAFEAYNLCDFLLVNTIVPFHEPMFHFLLVFKLFPIHSCQIPMDLYLYPPLGKKKLMGVDAKLQLKVGYWASRNGLHDDNIYKRIIKMFIPKSLSNLPQP